MRVCPDTAMVPISAQATPADNQTAPQPSADSASSVHAMTPEFKNPLFAHSYQFPDYPARRDAFSSSVMSAV